MIKFIIVFLCFFSSKQVFCDKALFSQIKMALNRGQFDLAAEIGAQLPDSVKKYLLMADFAKKNGSQAKALSHYSKAFELAGFSNRRLILPKLHTQERLLGVASQRCFEVIENRLRAFSPRFSRFANRNSKLMINLANVSANTGDLHSCIPDFWLQIAALIFWVLFLISLIFGFSRFKKVVLLLIFVALACDVLSRTILASKKIEFALENKALFSGPSKEYQEIGSLAPGTGYWVCQFSEKNDFKKVQTIDGRRGWIAN